MLQKRISNEKVALMLTIQTQSCFLFFSFESDQNVLMACTSLRNSKNIQNGVFFFFNFRNDLVYNNSNGKGYT